MSSPREWATPPLGSTTPATTSNRDSAQGCRNCQTLEKEARAAIAELGLAATVEKVTAYPDIAAYGILSTPGLVLDEEVVVSGRVPRRAEIVRLLAARSQA